MLDVNTLLWQSEIFLSMSTKVADPSLAATLRQTAANYVSRATEAARQQKINDIAMSSVAA
jgi:hypothetical protein